MRASERRFFTARFAKDAESAKGNDFSIAVERTAMENHSAVVEFGSERPYAALISPVHLPIRALPDKGRSFLVCALSAQTKK